MVSSKRQQKGIYHDNLLEVMHDRLSIKKIVGGYKEVPL
jgi:hypothetical protein